MTVQSFMDNIKTALRRGTSQDANVPRWCRNAVKYHEQNYDFAHMLRVGELEASASADTPEVIDLPNGLVKSVIMIQPYVEGADGTRSYSAPLEKVERQRMVPGRGTAAGWYHVANTIVLDATPTSDATFEALWREFTEWPTSGGGLGGTPAILDKYETLLFAEVMWKAWLELKDFESAAAWKSQRDEALQVALIAEETQRWSGQKLSLNMDGWTGGRDRRLAGVPYSQYVPPITENTDFVGIYDAEREG